MDDMIKLSRTQIARSRGKARTYLSWDGTTAHNYSYVLNNWPFIIMPDSLATTLQHTAPPFDASNPHRLLEIQASEANAPYHQPGCTEVRSGQSRRRRRWRSALRGRWSPSSRWRPPAAPCRSRCAPGLPVPASTPLRFQREHPKIQ